MARKRFVGFIAVFQSVIFLTHFLLYETWRISLAGSDTPGQFWIKMALGLLSVSFVTASILAFRYTNASLRAFYRVAAVWLGLLTYLFFATVLSWSIFGVAWLAGLHVNFHRTVELLFGVAVVVGLYGVVNASWTRITRTTVRLVHLPAAWRGRKAALISDLHLGHVRNGSFLRRIVATIFSVRSIRLPDSRIGKFILDEKIRTKLLTIPVPLRIGLVVRGLPRRKDKQIRDEGWTVLRFRVGNAEPESFDDLDDLLKELVRES